MEVLLLLACAHPVEPTADACSGDCGASAEAPHGTVRALLINGGASPAHNYSSHFQHLREMRGALLARGLGERDIDVFCSDGADSAPDMATLDLPEQSFLLEGTPGEALVGPEIVNTRWDGVPLRPATRGALDSWFRQEGARMSPGDTVLLYATDHGTEAGLNLWQEQLSPSQLSGMGRSLPKGVRLVTVMSQCHSGTFANAASTGIPDGRTCGFYSVPRDLVAYGCYAGGHDDRIGHGFRFVDALGTAATLADAQRAVVLADDSPDVPVTTSDLYLERLLRERAVAEDVPLTTLIGRLLPAGGQDPSLDALSQRFGVPTLRTLDAVSAERERADAAEEALAASAEAWGQLLDDANVANLYRLAQTDPTWTDRIAEGVLADEHATRDAVRDALVVALLTQADADGTWADLAALAERRDAVDDARWQELTRRRVADRAGRQIFREAGEKLLEDPALSREAEGYRRLLECEGTALGTAPAVAAPAGPTWSPPGPDEAEDLAPRWLGVRLGEIEAARIEAVLPGSPATDSGLQAGDLLRAIDGHPVRRRADIVNRIALAPPGTALVLELDRDGERIRMEIVPGARPAG